MRRNQKSEIMRLAADIRLHRYLYYNKQPRISNQAFDALINQMKQLDPDNDVLKETGAPAAEDSGWQKVPHLLRMASLANAMSEKEFFEWVTATSAKGKVFVAEDKFDGLSVELVYENGQLVQAITRGDGRTGDEILINARKMRYVPETLPEKIKAGVRGEIMLMRADFDFVNQNSTKQYKNPRNAAAGICKRFDGQFSDRLCVVVYDIISPDINFSFETEKMDYLSKQLGFVTANYKLITATEVVKLRQQYMESLRDKLPYNIDGMVIKINSIQRQKILGLHPNGDPKGQIAFKFDAKGYATTLLDVVWTVGRTGVLTHNAVIDPVDIDGTTVKAASIHNIDEIERLGVGVGDKIMVIKAGEIIPKVIEVIDAKKKGANAPTKCPACGGKVEREGANLVCKNENCTGQTFRKLRHWIDTLKKRMGLDAIGESTIEQLYEKKLIEDPADFFTLTEDQLSSIDRAGEKSAKKIASGLAKCKEMDVVTFLAGLGIPSLGTTMAETITDEYDLYSLMEEVTEADLAKISGIGDNRAKEILKGLEERRGLIEKLMSVGITIKKAADAVKLQSNKLAGKSFQITGALTMTNPDTKKPWKRDEWYEFVQANGGSINRVNKDLDYLIVIRASSNKVKKAQQLGVKMISEDDFWKMVE